MPRLSHTPLRFTWANAEGEKANKKHKMLKIVCAFCALLWPCFFIPPELYDIYVRGLYVLLKLFLALVTENVPSCWADTLIQNAAPLCAGAGGAPGPGGGAWIGATAIAFWGSSIVFAMNIPGTVYSCPLSWEKWICQRSSRPGAE